MTFVSFRVGSMSVGNNCNLIFVIGLCDCFGIDFNGNKDETFFSFSAFLSLQQLLVGQTATTAPTTTSVSAQSPLSETNPPSLSPNGGTQPGALSPGGLSQTSQNAGTTAASLSNGGTGANGGASSASTCCENGRPIMTDPVSGQTVCSCQYDSARLALSSYSRLPSAGVYGTPYPSTDQNPYPSIGVDSSAFYSPLVSTKTTFLERPLYA